VLTLADGTYNEASGRAHKVDTAASEVNSLSTRNKWMMVHTTTSNTTVPKQTELN
jgi:hypothetical protein